MTKYNVAIIGATGMVGQRFLTLLQDHPWFHVVTLAASARSAGKTYEEAVAGRWAFDWPIPEKYKNMTIVDASDIAKVAEGADFAFCAIDLSKQETRDLEDAYAKAELPIVSNNSAHRHTPDVPMMIPEINDDHMTIIDAQRKRLGTKLGFVAVKPNCSIQGYVPALHPLREFGLKSASVCTYQAISGAGKTFATWPEMVDNVIPYIGGEEEKSEIEPLKIWGKISGNEIVSSREPLISAQCVRIAAADGHMAAVSVSFDRLPEIDEILACWDAYEGLPQRAKLPSAPAKFLTYFTEDNRPQTRLDRDMYNGMGITIGRLRRDSIFDYKFVSLSHNTVRGAAGGAVLTAEMLCHAGYIVHK